VADTEVWPEAMDIDNSCLIAGEASFKGAPP